MNFIQGYKKAFGVLAALGLTTSCLLNAYNTVFTDHVANSLLNTYEVVQNKVKEKPKPPYEPNFIENIKYLFKKREAAKIELTPRDILEATYKQMDSKTTLPAELIDTTFVNKMELVHGEARLHDHLITRLTSHKKSSFLSTTAGLKEMAKMVTQPTNDLSIIQGRQAIIKTLVENDKLRNECFQLLQKMKKVEPFLYDLYQKDGIDESEKALYLGKLFDLLGLNKSPGTISFGTRLAVLMPIVLLVIEMGLPIAVIAFGKYLNSDDLQMQGKIYLGINIPLATAGGLQLTGVLKALEDARKDIQRKLIGVATYINSLRKVVYLCGSNSTIKQHLPELKTVSQHLYKADQAPDEFNKLNELLRKSTFSEGEPSYFSSPGNILVAYKYIVDKKVRQEYIQAMELIGQLDAYVALAQKIKAHEKLDAAFCFVQFTDADKPYINAVNFWNPFINPRNVVPNTVVLNGGNERDIILTGPNTGGKSTLMKALMDTLLLAHTFGVAPAQSLTITPFAKLLVYLNITDDTGAGVSLFKAEVKRAQELMEMLRSLKPHEFAFVIIDEIFTGTAPEKAEELSYKFIKQMSEFANCLFIDATHFKKLVELEKDTNGVCKNYHTGVILDPADPTKVAKYTYKLTEGPSPINNAQQVAEETGVFNF